MLRLRQHPPALYVSSRRSGLSALQGEAVPAAVGHEAKRGGPAAPGLGFPRGNRGTATRPRSATARSHTSQTPGSGTKHKHPADLLSAPPAACHELGWKRHDALKKHPKPKNTRARPSHVHPAPPGARHPLPSPLIFWGGLFPSLSLPGGSAQGFQMPPGFPNAPPGSTAAPPGGSTSPGGSRTAPRAPRGEAGGAGPPPSAPPGLQPGASPPKPLQPQGEGAAGASPGQVLQDLLLDEAGHASHRGGRLSAEAGGAPSPLRRRRRLLPAPLRPGRRLLLAPCRPHRARPEPPRGLKAPGAALAAPRPRAGLGPGSSSTPRGGRRGAG